MLACSLLAAGLTATSANADGRPAALAIAGASTPAAVTARPDASDSAASASASEPARQFARWVVDSRDHLDLPFAIVDKTHAAVHVFDAQGRPLGGSAVLLGLATGDHSVPGIGQRKLSTIRPEERTTPAGRFVVSVGHNLQGEDILWIDYEAAVSLHRVVAGTAAERRAQRLASGNPQQRRISYGCINVPIDFFDRVIAPVFTGTSGIVYVLPETRTYGEVFAGYGIEHEAHRVETSRATVQVGTVAAGFAAH